MDRYFLSYILLILGSLVVTVAFLGRFMYRGRVKFQFDDLIRIGFFILGLGILVGAVLLYAYQFEVDQIWSAATPTLTQTLTPTPTPTLTPTPTSTLTPIPTQTITPQALLQWMRRI